MWTCLSSTACMDGLHCTSHARVVAWTRLRSGALPTIQLVSCSRRTRLVTHTQAICCCFPQALLETVGHEALLNKKDHQGMTPLDLAIQNGHDELATLLQSRGGPTPGTASIQPVMEPAETCPANQPELSASTDSRQAAAWALSPLVVAARQADLAAVQQLLPSTMRCMAEADKEGMLRAAVEAAVVGGSVEVLRLLLDSELTVLLADEALLTKVRQGGDY